MNFLAPLGWLYRLIMQVRNALYELGILRSYNLGARTISVGNITTGGTGKTPLVAYIAKLLADDGEKVCILTRGYRRQNENKRILISDGTTIRADAKTGGDEPVELAHLLLGKAIVIADADRISAARWAKGKFGITSFLFDDGFQHRRARRDFDIVCVDATDPFGKRTMLREPISGLSRANAIVITRADLADNVDELSSQLRRYNADAPIFRARGQIVSYGPTIERAKDGHGTQTYFAFCAIGNPDAFFEMLRRNEIEVNGKRAFPDHHIYTQSDMDELVKAAEATGTRTFLTTGKDIVKLKGLNFDRPCYLVEIETVIDDPDRFRELVLSA